MEMDEEGEYKWRRRRSVRTLSAMLRRSCRGPFQPIQEMDGAVGGAEETKAPAPSDPKHDPFQTTPSDPKHDLFQTTPSNPKHDLFQTTPSDPKHDLFQTTPSDPKHDLFQTTLSNPKHDLFQTTPSDPKHDLFQTTPSDPKHDLFQTTPSDPKHDLFQTTPSDPKHDLFQTTPSDPKHDLFQTTPSDPKHDLFQITPSYSKHDPFQTTPSDPKHDLFQTTPSEPKHDLFQTTPSNPKHDLFQTTPSDPKHDLFQITPSYSKHDLFQTTPSDPKHDLFQTTPSEPKHDLFQTTPSDPKHDLFQTTPSDPKHDLFQTTPSDPKHDLFQTTPSNPKHGLFQITPSYSKHDPFQATPSDPKHDPFQATPSDPKHDLFQTTPSEPKHDLFQTTPSEPKHDLFQITPSYCKHDPFQTTPSDPKHDLFQTTPSNPKHDPFQTTPSDPKHDPFQTTPSDPKHDPFQTTPSLSKHEPFQSKLPKLKEDSASGDGVEYPVYQNVFLIGEEKCVEDWPEDSPELSPDWKPAGRLRLRRESMKVVSAARMEWGDEDLMENNDENNYKAKKSRRFSLPTLPRRQSKSEADLVQKGADLFRGREGEEDEPDGVEECSVRQKRGKKFRITFLQRRDSKDTTIQEDPPGATCRNYHLSEATESEADLVQKGADLFRGREGEEDEPDGVEECSVRQKRGKKFRITFLQRRDSKETTIQEDPPGATCRNYHLSEATEAEWLSAQRDGNLTNGWETEESGGKEDGDTDSLMEWWNTVEQWDELPSDDEDWVGDCKMQDLKVLAEKVQKGIHVFNKVFMEQAESLWGYIIDLNAIAENIHEFHRKAKIASITGGTTSAVGGATAIAGLALAPVTLGVSLIITAVGIGVATAGGLTSASATISDSVHSSHDRKKVEKIVDDYRAKMADISKCLRYVQQGLEKLLAYNLLKMDLAGGQGPGRAVQMASEANGASERAVEICAQVGSMLTGLKHGLDEYYLEQDPKKGCKSELGCKTEFAAKVQDVANRLHQALVELNSIREELQDSVYHSF